jgi:hypothetical protein
MGGVSVSVMGPPLLLSLQAEMVTVPKTIVANNRAADLMVPPRQKETRAND